MKVTTGLISLIVPYGDYEYEGEPKLDLISDILKGICGTQLDYFVCAGRKNGFAAIRVEFNSYSNTARKDIEAAAKQLVETLDTQGVLVFMDGTDTTA